MQHVQTTTDSLFFQIFENTSEAVLLVGPDLVVEAANPVFSGMTGHSVAAGEPLDSFFAVFRHVEARRAMLREVRREGRWRGEVWGIGRNGEHFPARCTFSAQCDHTGRIVRYIALFQDLTEARRNESRLYFQTHYDAVTGLPNRNLILKRLEAMLAKARRAGQRQGVLFLDIDRFNQINESYGHHGGDSVMVQTARRLREVFCGLDTVGRQGNDEFVVLLDQTAMGRSGADLDLSGSKAARTVGRIMEVMAAPFDIDGYRVFCSVSMGLAAYPEDGDTGVELMRKAETAMHHARRRGEGGFDSFRSEMSVRSARDVSLRNALRGALERREFFLHYQPKVDLFSGRITGAEALIRWRHPEMGLISPALFIPVAEESDIILRLGEWTLFQACRQAARWRAAGMDLPSISVNLSPRQFSDPHLCSKLATVLKRSGLEAGRLEIEITETAVIGDMAKADEMLRGIKALGIHLALDDFGTGYSSLSHLRRFPLDTLKIDRSFIRDALTRPEDQAIVPAVIAMASALGINVVAEGVEDRDQADWLIDYGCRTAQGYLFGRPIPPRAFSRLWRAGVSAGSPPR